MAFIYVSRYQRRNPAGFRYSNVSAALDSIRVDMIAKGLDFEDVLLKYRPLIARPFKVRSFYEVLRMAGIIKAKAKVLKGVNGNGDNSAHVAVSEAVAHTVIARVQDQAHHHFDRMALFLDKVYAAMERSPITPENLSASLDELDAFDKLARRVFGMDEEKPKQSRFGRMNLRPIS